MKEFICKKDYYIDKSISLQLPESINQGLILEGNNNSAIIHCVGGIYAFTVNCSFIIIRNLTFFSDTHDTGSALNITGYNLLIHNCYLHIESWADIVVVVPKSIIGSEIIIGEGTKYEMEHAKSFGKPVLIYY